LVVLQSFPVPRATTNPYIVMLYRALQAEPEVQVWTFSFRRALTGRYDVFHAHWPEVLVSGHSPLKAFLRQCLFLAVLARLWLRRTPVVRTVHNLRLPTGISRREKWLLRLTERLTTLRIRLNETTELPPDQPVATILHGHYRDWFAAYALPSSAPGRVTFFGLIRRYKGVDTLIDAFRETTATMPELTLRVAGQPSTDELADQLRSAADGDERISLAFEFLTDQELADEVGRAELVVLPYREMHNSGGALTALSLGRPVLVPDNDNNRRLGEEVGPGWVHRFDGALTGEHIVRTVTELRDHPAVAPPDLSAREWTHAGSEHRTVYLAAVQGRRHPH
jgi:beta-1,4-mannosyltransferase